jgi:hypothetical protein
MRLSYKIVLLPSSIEGLMGLWEEQAVSLPFNGLELSDERFLLGSLATPTAHHMRDVNPN